MSRRTEMLGRTIQKELAQIIMRDLHDPRITGLPSITRVKVSADLSTADVYVTVMGTPGVQTAALNALRHSSGLMRTRLTKSLTLRVAPYIKFHLDEDLKKELVIMDLLDQVHRENEELDRKRAEAAALAAANDPGAALASPDQAPSTGAAESPATDPAPAPLGPGEPVFAGQESSPGHDATAAARPAFVEGNERFEEIPPRAQAGQSQADQPQSTGAEEEG